MLRTPNWLTPILPPFLMMTMFVMGVSQSWAQCATGQVGLTTSGATLAPYNPFAAKAIRTITVSVKNNSLSQCDLSLSFPSTSTTQAPMTNGAGSTLNYIVENAANNKIIFYTGGTPVAADRVEINNLNAGATRNVTVDVSALIGQVVADGTYNDSGMEVHVFNRAGSVLTRIGQKSFPVSATVAKICKLDPPSLTSLNFNSAISNGRANPGVTKATSFTNVQCTAPTIVRLSGAALQPVPAIAARANFDNFIGWHAVGTFGGATSTLNATASTVTTADSAAKNVASGATSNGTIGVTVNLLDSGKPILAGTYSGVLTVTIDPTL